MFLKTYIIRNLRFLSFSHARAHASLEHTRKRISFSSLRIYLIGRTLSNLDNSKTNSSLFFFIFLFYRADVLFVRLDSLTEGNTCVSLRLRNHHGVILFIYMTLNFNYDASGMERARGKFYNLNALGE